MNNDIAKMIAETRDQIHINLTDGTEFSPHEVEKLCDRLESALSASAEPVAWQAKRSDGSPLAVWEACTPEAYLETRRTGRYLGFENGPAGVARALYTNAPPPASCNPTTQPPTAVPDGAVDVRRPNCTSTEGVLVYFDSAEAADRYFSDLDGVLSQPAVASAPSSLQGFGPMPSADLSGLTIRPTTPETRT